MGVILNNLALVCRFDVIFRRHFKGTFSKSSGHLWRHINSEVADFQTPTYDQDMGMPINVLRTSMHLRMMLYALDELFYVYRGMDTNDVDGQHVIAYEILTVALLYCIEWHGNPKKACNTLGNAYPRVNLNDVNGLECLAWAIYDGVYVPCDLPVLKGHHNWEHIITGTTLCLIFCGATNNEHCEPSMVASLNVKQATKLAQQQGLLWPKQRRSQATSATEAWRTPTVQLVVNVLPQAASSCSMGGAQATLLDFDEDTDDENSFHESGRCIML